MSRLLFDTHLLIWSATDDAKLSYVAQALIDDPQNTLIFSAVSIWEVAIKAARRRADFGLDPLVLRRGLIDNGYIELPVTGVHAAAVALLPDVHKDPFDRLLVAQAGVEGVTLLTADAQLDGYPGPIRRV